MISISGFQIIFGKVCFLILVFREGFCQSAPAAGRVVVSFSSVTHSFLRQGVLPELHKKRVSEQRTADPKAPVKETLCISGASSFSPSC